jgi:hypothetical protein
VSPCVGSSLFCTGHGHVPDMIWSYRPSCEDTSPPPDAVGSSIGESSGMMDTVGTRREASSVVACGRVPRTADGMLGEWATDTVSPSRRALNREGSADAPDGCIPLTTGSKESARAEDGIDDGITAAELDLIPLIPLRPSGKRHSRPSRRHRPHGGLDGASMSPRSHLHFRARHAKQALYARRAGVVVVVVSDDVGWRSPWAAGTAVTSFGCGWIESMILSWPGRRRGRCRDSQNSRQRLRCGRLWCDVATEGGCRPAPASTGLVMRSNLSNLTSDRMASDTAAAAAAAAAAGPA